MSKNEYLKTIRSELEQVGWIYTYSDATKKIPPVLSRHRLDNKHAWIERPIYAEDQTPTVGAFSAEEESAEMDRQPNIAAGTAQENRRVQARWDAAHERAYALNMPAVNAAQERFEAGEIEIEEFEQAITATKQRLTLA